MKGEGKSSGLIGGTVWTTVSFVVVTIVYLLRISVLTRYLDKDAFGIVAIVLFILGFTSIFADLGVSSALLSQKNVSKKEYSSLYWGGLIISVILYFILIIVTPVFSYVYEYDGFNVLIPLMGLDLIVGSIGRQFAVFKQKEFKFKELALIKISSEILSLVVAVILAVNGYGIWSLVVSLLITSFLNSLLNFILGYKSHPLILYFNYKSTKHLYKIGFFQAGSQIFDYISSQIDILLLGKLLPMSDMGVYSIIKNLVLRVYSSLNQVITKVAVPYFAKLNIQSPEYKNNYLSVLFLVFIINAFFYFGIFVKSSDLLSILYGTDYAIYMNVLKTLTIWGLFSSIINCSASILVISSGRTDLGFKWTQIRLFLNPLFIFCGAYFGGILGVAILQAVYSILTIFLYNSVVIKKLIPSLTVTEMFHKIKSILLLILILYPILLIISFLSAFLELNSYIDVVINFGVILIGFYFIEKKSFIKNLKVLKQSDENVIQN